MRTYIIDLQRHAQTSLPASSCTTSLNAVQ